MGRFESIPAQRIPLHHPVALIIASSCSLWSLLRDNAYVGSMYTFRPPIARLGRTRRATFGCLDDVLSSSQRYCIFLYAPKVVLYYGESTVTAPKQALVT